MGDGGFLFCMEKRGYVKAGVWTPEATVEHPEAGNKVFIAFSFLITKASQSVVLDSLVPAKF